MLKICLSSAESVQILHLFCCLFVVVVFCCFSVTVVGLVALTVDCDVSRMFRLFCGLAVVGRFLYSAILRSRADSMRSRVSLHE